MPCAGFEGRLVDYGELSEGERRSLDAHLAACSACREYLDALEFLDSALAASFSNVAAPEWLARRVRARIQPPSQIPEMLDAFGWLGISAVVAVIVWYTRNTVDMMPWAFGAVGAVLIVGFWMSLRSLAKFRS